MKTQIQVLENTNIAELEDDINEMLAEGWKLNRGIVPVVSNNGQPTVYLQVVVYHDGV